MNPQATSQISASQFPQVYVDFFKQIAKDRNTSISRVARECLEVFYESVRSSNPTSQKDAIATYEAAKLRYNGRPPDKQQAA